MGGSGTKALHAFHFEIALKLLYIEGMWSEMARRVN